MRSIDELVAEICTLAGHINAAHHRWLKLIAEFDALEKLPKISAAMERGNLSYSKVREISRVGNAGNEDYLLMIAECGTAAHVEKLVRAYRRCQEAEELSREARQKQNRSVSLRYDDDVSLILSCRLPAEAGALVLKALELALEKLPADARPASDVPAGTPIERVPFSVRRADALALVAESFVAHEVLECHGTDRHQIAMAAETARRFACDASIVNLVESEDGEPLNLGRKMRTISAPLRRLLNARDKGCRFPGCGNSRYIDAHHVVHWANGGETKPSILVSLCRFHHRAVHEGGMRIDILDDGALRFVKPNGSGTGLSCRPEPRPIAGAASEWTTT